MSRSTRTSITVIRDPEGVKHDRYHIDIPPRTVQVLWAGAILGTIIGFRRGVRVASLRFLAENAHNPPRTKSGWYFYKKTKNYRMLLQGFTDAGRWAGRLGVIGLGWVTIEEVMDRAGWDNIKEIVAGLAVSGTFVLWYRTPFITSRQIMALGLTGGVLARGLRSLQTWSDGKRQILSSTDPSQSSDGEA